MKFKLKKGRHNWRKKPFYLPLTRQNVIAVKRYYPNAIGSFICSVTYEYLYDLNVQNIVSCRHFILRMFNYRQQFNTAGFQLKPFRNNRKFRKRLLFYSVDTTIIPRIRLKFLHFLTSKIINKNSSKKCLN